MKFHEPDLPELLNGFAHASTRAIQDLRATISGVELRKAITMLNAAHSIHVVGNGQAFALAATLVEGLRRQARACHLRGPANASDLQWLRDMYDTDLLVAIHLPERAWPVSMLASAAHSRGIPLLGITDSPLSPVARYADLHFAVSSAGHVDVPPLAPHFVLIQSLLIGLQRWHVNESGG